MVVRDTGLQCCLKMHLCELAFIPTITTHSCCNAERNSDQDPQLAVVNVLLEVSFSFLFRFVQRKTKFPLLLVRWFQKCTYMGLEMLVRIRCAIMCALLPQLELLCVQRSLHRHLIHYAEDKTYFYGASAFK